MKPPVEAPVSRATLPAGETAKWSRAPASFSPPRLTKGGDSLTVTRAASGTRAPALGEAKPFHLHPAGQDQGLGLGPALGQAPGHQELVETGFGFWVCGFQISVSGFQIFSGSRRLGGGPWPPCCYETVHPAN